jgi:hypothetical protein
VPRTKLGLRISKLWRLEGHAIQLRRLRQLRKQRRSLSASVAAGNVPSEQLEQFRKLREFGIQLGRLLVR